jgi:hypothetical protein
MENEIELNGVKYRKVEPEPAFKVGDRVDYRGDNGTVVETEVRGKLMTYLIHMDDGTHGGDPRGWWAFRDLRRIDTPAPAPAHEYKFGDRVKAGGRDGVVIARDPKDIKMEYYVAFATDETWGDTDWYSASDLTPDPAPQRIELRVGDKVRLNGKYDVYTIFEDDGDPYCPLNYRCDGDVFGLPRVIEVLP